MLMAVVRALKSRASTAAGEVISCHAELLTVQITRLKIGRAMNPASSESAPTARPPDRYPLPKSLLLLLLSSTGRSAGTGDPEMSMLPDSVKAPLLHHPLSLVGEY
jgi:hypothetical protein